MVKVYTGKYPQCFARNLPNHVLTFNATPERYVCFDAIRLRFEFTLIISSINTTNYLVNVTKKDDKHQEKETKVTDLTPGGNMRTGKGHHPGTHCLTSDWGKALCSAH